MYFVAANENGKILPETIRIIDKKKYVLKHLRWIASNCWPIKYSLEKILDNNFYVVYDIKVNQLNNKPKIVSKGIIKSWILDEKFEKVQVDAKPARQSRTAAETNGNVAKAYGNAEEGIGIPKKGARNSSSFINF